MTGRWPVAVGIAAVLGGCAVGPDFVRPAPPRVDGYVAGGAPTTLAPGEGEAEQRVVLGEAIATQWWELYRSRAITEVVRLALP